MRQRAYGAMFGSKTSRKGGCGCFGIVSEGEVGWYKNFSGWFHVNHRHQSCVKKMSEEEDVVPGSIPRSLHSARSGGRERATGGTSGAAAAWKEAECGVPETQSGGNMGEGGKAGEVVVGESQSGDDQREARRAGDVWKAEEVAVVCDGKAEVGGGEKSAGVEILATACERAGYPRRNEGTLADAGGSSPENAKAKVLKGSKTTVDEGSEADPRSPQSSPKRSRIETPRRENRPPDIRSRVRRE